MYYSLGEVWDLLTRPSNICAALAIVCVQYRSGVVDLLYTAREDGVQQAFLNLVLGLADMARGYYHASREVVRNFGHCVFFFVGDGTNDNNDGDGSGGGYAGYSLAQKDAASHSQNNGTSSRRGSNNHKRYSSLGQPPPLVLVVGDTNSTAGTKNEPIVVSSSSTIGGDASRIAATATATDALKPKPSPSGAVVGNEMLEPLEPAFLDKDNYPEGWLVYHPVLGVVSVKEAERYDDQQLLLAVTQKEKQQHAPKTEGPRCTTNTGVVKIGLVAKTATTNNDNNNNKQ